MPPPSIVLGAGAVVLLAVALVAGRAPRERRGPAWLSAAAALPLPEGLLARARARDAGERLVAAGLDGVAGPDDLARARVGAVMVALGLGGVAALIAPPTAVLVPVLALAAGLLPGRLLDRRAAVRRREVLRALPDVLDLLSICVEGGMALDPALGVAARHAPGPLGRELQRAIAEIALGSMRAEAYRALGRRCAVPELVAAVNALVQAEELGTPLAGALAAQAAMARDAARRAALERAAKAGPKIQLVVAVVLVPAALVLIIGAFAVELSREVGGILGGAAP